MKIKKVVSLMSAWSRKGKHTEKYKRFVDEVFRTPYDDLRYISADVRKHLKIGDVRPVDFLKPMIEYLEAAQSFLDKFDKGQNGIGASIAEYIEESLQTAKECLDNDDKPLFVVCFLLDEIDIITYRMTTTSYRVPAYRYVEWKDDPDKFEIIFTEGEDTTEEESNGNTAEDSESETEEV